MPIEFICPACQTKLRVGDEHAGKKAKCPHCGAIAQVPGSAAPVKPVPVQPIPVTPPPVSAPPPANPYGDPGQSLPPLSNPYTDTNVAPPSSNPYVSAPSNPYQSTSVHVGAANYKVAHRGGLILVLGLMSIFCNFAMVPGILAWVLGKGDLKQMDSGHMDPSGRGMTTAGMVIGMVMTCLIIAGLAIYMCIFVLFLIGGIANM